MMRHWRYFAGAAVGLAVVLAVGCGGGEQSSPEAPAKLSRAQRDSVTAASRLPGAGGVRQALADADSAAARAARLDGQSR